MHHRALGPVVFSTTLGLYFEVTSSGDWHDVVRAGAFLALANLKLDDLAVIQRCVIVTAANFRVMNE